MWKLFLTQSGSVEAHTVSVTFPVSVIKIKGNRVCFWLLEPSQLESTAELIEADASSWDSQESEQGLLLLPSPVPIPQESLFGNAHNTLKHFSYVIRNPVKLTMEINHHTHQH